MAWLVTPAQLARRSEFFHQLGQTTAAGLGLISALEILHRSPPQPSLRPALARSLAALREGMSVSEALARGGHWLSSFDIALIAAREQLRSSIIRSFVVGGIPWRP